MKTTQAEHKKSSYEVSISGLIHRVWQPSAEGTHPTIVLIHGKAGNEDVSWVFSRQLPKEWLIVAPRAIYVDEKNGGYSWEIRNTQDWSTFDSLKPATNALHQFIQSLPELYGADLDNLYLMGFSQGAALSYAYTMRHPDIIQGLATMVGFVPSEVEQQEEYSNLKNKRIWMAVGREDETIPLIDARNGAKVLIDAGVKLQYNEYDTGHKMNRQGMKDLAKWWIDIEAYYNQK